MTGDSKARTVYEFAKNLSEVVRFRLTEFHGHKLVDVRVFFESDEGEWLPTKKGIAVSVDHIDELLAGVLKAKKAGLDGS